MLLPESLADRFKLGWKWLHNRNERVSFGDVRGVACDWQDSSFLTVAQVFPSVGARLLHHCLRKWPIHGSAPHVAGAQPTVSVVLPVGGADRLPLYEATTRSFLGQEGVACELVTVEHSEVPVYEQAARQSNARYVHLPRAFGEEFNKSLAMNKGVEAASGAIVVLHDADVPVPCDFVRSALSVLDLGFEAVRPIRLLFLLDELQTDDYLAGEGISGVRSVNRIHANFPGLSTVVRKSTYEAIGGHDERFVGWGGEDLEFLDRLRTRRLARGSYCPAIHLWHRPAPKKANGNRNNELVDVIRREDSRARIDRLRKLQCTN